jgi:hypothetical protein
MPRTLFVGDVHGCSAELRDLLEVLQPSRVLLCGDVFTRGPDPAGCWELVQRFGAQSVLGNHDARMLERRAEALRGKGRTVADRAVRALTAQPDALAWLEGLPLFLEGPGWLLVHAGLHPKRGRAGTARDQALRLRRWPDDTDRRNPFWWQRWAKHRRTGAPMVIHGHDAVRGLRDHRPVSLGLDAGCVFGGALCGYLLEEDRIIQVPARRTYMQPGG